MLVDNCCIVLYALCMTYIPDDSIITQLPERLLAKIEVRSPEECWPWKGSTNGIYGQLSFESKHWVAHRLVYTLTHGPIEEGLEVMHVCDNPLCCNPAHLMVGTHIENMRQMADRGRRAKFYGMRRVDRRARKFYCEVCRAWLPLAKLSRMVRIERGKRIYLCEMHSARVSQDSPNSSQNLLT